MAAPSFPNAGPADSGRQGPSPARICGPGTKAATGHPGKGRPAPAGYARRPVPTRLPEGRSARCADDGERFLAPHETRPRNGPSERHATASEPVFFRNGARSVATGRPLREREAKMSRFFIIAKLIVISRRVRPACRQGAFFNNVLNARIVQMMRNSFWDRLFRAARSAWGPAWRTALWVIRMVVPITLGISVLEYTGAIGWISDRLSPLFSHFGLPGRSGLVFLSAALSTNYSAVAVIAALGLDYRSATILAVMALICHNLIIESAVQRKTGASAWGMTLLRIAAAFVAAAALNALLPADMDGRLLLPAAGRAPESWGEVLATWVRMIVPLSLKMGAIIVTLNVLQNILREFRLIDALSVPLRPLMSAAGLPRSTSFLWIICNVVGITYGGAALVDEMQRGGVSRADARLLNTHVAISHSLLEDTIVFASAGIGLFWLLVPRLLLAVVAVWTLRGLRMLGRRREGRTAPTGK